MQPAAQKKKQPAAQLAAKGRRCFGSPGRREEVQVPGASVAIHLTGLDIPEIWIFRKRLKMIFRYISVIFSVSTLAGFLILSPVFGSCDTEGPARSERMIKGRNISILLKARMSNFSSSWK